MRCEHFEVIFSKDVLHVKLQNLHFGGLYLCLLLTNFLCNIDALFLFDLLRFPPLELCPQLLGTGGLLRLHQIDVVHLLAVVNLIPFALVLAFRNLSLAARFRPDRFRRGSKSLQRLGPYKIAINSCPVKRTSTTYPAVEVLCLCSPPSAWICSAL